MYHRFAFIVILFIAFRRSYGAGVAESGNSTASDTPAVRHSGCLIRTTAGYYVVPCQPQTTFRDATAERERQLRQQWTTLLLIIYARQVRNSGSSDWGDWGPCSVLCGSGTRQRTRICGSRVNCVSEETEQCQPTCTAGWGTWTTQGTCSSTCGEERGLQRYTRQCGSESGCVGANERYGWCTAGVDCSFEENCRRKGGLLNSGKCFTIIHGQMLGVAPAAQACADEGASLAEFETSAQYTELLNFALENKPADADEYYVLTLGMTYDLSDSTVMYRGGQKIPFDQFVWTSFCGGVGTPRTTSSFTQIYLSADLTGVASEDFVPGLYNQITVFDTDGAICENNP